MGKYEFFEGQELTHIWWDGESCMYTEVKVGSNSVVSIKVSMECGQMAAVAWAVVFLKNGRCLKYNLALATGIELALKGE